MRFEKVLPVTQLKPYVKYLVLSENNQASTYKVFPSTALVMGFQYKGKLSFLKNDKEQALSVSGITGLMDGFKIFTNTPDIGTVLVFFTETGMSHFANQPVNELFNQSIGLDNLFSNSKVRETEGKLAYARTDLERLNTVQQFLLAELKARQDDKLIIEAVRLIYASKGTIRIKELNERLCISQSPFEKRFRKIVGTSPKKFAAIVRFNTVLNTLGGDKSLAEICYEHSFFDQAHFIKDFKQYTGETPDQFRQSL